jgi:hypothetical protein
MYCVSCGLPDVTLIPQSLDEAWCYCRNCGFCCRIITDLSDDEFGTELQSTGGTETLSEIEKADLVYDGVIEEEDLEDEDEQSELDPTRR